jgi:mannose-1-phosphate guanylyltransferase/mannose-6-phosphate isomerase
MHAVVLAGGAGQRFWPASRRARPKPFLPLLGDRTLFRSTLERLARLAPRERTWVIGTRELASELRRAVRGFAGVRLLLEPEPRNTAAAFALAAARVEARDPGALVAFFPSDHHIPHRVPFARVVRAGARAAARADALVLIGIEPTAPDPAYGYFRLAKRAIGGGARRVERFVEKPSVARARRLLADPGWLWNSGMLVAPAARVLDECRTAAPRLWAALGGPLERIATRARLPERALRLAYRRAPAVSFDVAVLERSRRVLGMRGRFAWSDLGSWDALLRALPRRGGNALRGAVPVANIDAAGNVVWSSAGRAIALLGVEGLVIVDTSDALLVAQLTRAQDVRRIVEELQRRGLGALT